MWCKGLEPGRFFLLNHNLASMNSKYIKTTDCTCETCIKLLYIFYHAITQGGGEEIQQYTVLTV